MVPFYFIMSAIAGLIGWFTIFAIIIYPALQRLPRLRRLKILTSFHFFRYFGTTLLMTGLVVHKLPVVFARPAAFGDLASVVLAYVAFMAIQRSHNEDARLPLVWLFNIVGAIDLLVAGILGPTHIQNPADFGFTYFIPVFYVPLLFAVHFYAFKTLTERSHS